MPSPEDLEPGRAHFDAGRYFEAHEAFEDLWRRSTGDEKLFLQGLVQAAAALHKRAEGKAAGHDYLVGRARGNLARAPGAWRPWADAFLAGLAFPAPKMPPWPR